MTEATVAAAQAATKANTTSGSVRVCANEIATHTHNLTTILTPDLSSSFIYSIFGECPVRDASNFGGIGLSRKNIRPFTSSMSVTFVA